MSAADDLRHDCTTLFHFVQRVMVLCDNRGGPQRYPAASQVFLDYLSSLGEATLNFLDRFTEVVTTTDPILFLAYRQKLWSLRSGWRTLHSFVKPTKDADTLSVPNSLISVLTQRVSCIPGFEDARFAVFHTNELNYLHLNTGAIRDIAVQLSAIVPNCPGFPDDLGLIGIPYSQAGACHLNSLLAHEIGHYIYQKKTSLGGLVGLEKSMTVATEQALQPLLDSITAQDVEWFNARIVSWTRELFCDLFASRILGPTYTFSYLEISDLSTMADPSGIPLERSSVFNLSHPADVYRVREQCRQLEDTGWWDLIKDTKSAYLAALNAARTLADSKLAAPGKKDLAKSALNAFIAITPSIHHAIKETVALVDSGVEDFKEFDGGIRAHLVRGIVPSTVVVNGQRRFPGAVALINTAHKFCLESLDDLIRGIDGQDEKSARVRSTWYERVEMWTLKALEDNHLLTRQG